MHGTPRHDLEIIIRHGGAWRRVRPDLVRLSQLYQGLWQFSVAVGTPIASLYAIIPCPRPDRVVHIEQWPRHP